MALGLKGEFALHKSRFTAEIAFSLGLAIIFAVIIYNIDYWILQKN
jgi:hypothetical protein